MHRITSVEEFWSFREQVVAQIIQKEPDHIVIKVVANPLFDSTQRNLLAHGFQERLGTETRIDIVPVDDIPKEPSGKYRWVISKVPFEFNRLLKLQREQGGVRGARD